MKKSAKPSVRVALSPVVGSGKTSSKSELYDLKYVGNPQSKSVQYTDKINYVSKTQLENAKKLSQDALGSKASRDENVVQIGDPDVDPKTISASASVSGVSVKKDRKFRQTFTEDEEEDVMSLDEINRLLTVLKARKETMEKISPKDEKKEDVSLQILDFASPSSFVLLPQLDSVRNPFRNEMVPVGSISWLWTIDEFITFGYPLTPKGEFMKFLLDSAHIVQKQLNYVVAKIDKEGNIARKKSGAERTATDGMLTIFNVIKFCMYYPDASRQDERKRKGYMELARFIEEKNTNPGISPFAPSNLKQLESGETGDVCPPKDISLTVGGVVYSNILRYFTEFDKSEKVLSLVDGRTKLNYVCKPPKELELDWIPREHKQLKNLFNLYEIRYCDVTMWQNYMLTLQQHEIDGQDKARYWDSKAAQPYILVQDRNGTGYKVMRKFIYLGADHSPFPLTPENEEKISLRKWLLEQKMQYNVEKFASLLYVIMNTEAPSNKGSESSPGIYSNFIWEHVYNGSKRYFMRMDAPVRAFQTQLLRKYGRQKRANESWNDCKQEFVRNIWEACLDSSLNTSAYKLSESPDQVTRMIIEELFSFGGNQGCLVATKEVDIPVVKYNELVSMTKNEQDLVIESLKAFVEKDFPTESFKIEL
jgi:hypothetical protein